MANQVISDEYIEELFEGTNFGERVNNSTLLKRHHIAKHLKQQIEGFWSGHTMYHILIYGGFLMDAKTSETKRLTALGRAFLETHGNS
ncbi:hypothetical protein [Microbulbifer sp. THAF38]|uniref:hypothetical protein n=1 Tax=Microbulbifer sp. THAF38 TaxID=2587856 RepID=UPI0012686C4C|nr:hypothetical protein [Microbulbifer sp. THAF38]QFT55614.1 hypothetical protein FIU95_13750 [Microbulbifer sp. THAF38]